MPKSKSVEKRIWDLEGFDVRLLHEDGRDVRSDLAGLPQYSYGRAAKNGMTVTAWIENRFNSVYPGFRVEVLDGNGNPAHGATKLGTLRDSYVED